MNAVLQPPAASVARRTRAEVSMLFCRRQEEQPERLGNPILRVPDPSLRLTQRENRLGYRGAGAASLYNFPLPTRRLAQKAPPPRHNVCVGTTRMPVMNNNSGPAMIATPGHASQACRNKTRVSFTKRLTGFVRITVCKLEM